MKEDLIQLPLLKDIKEMLELSRNDIAAVVEDDPEMLPSSNLLNQVINIIEEKISNGKDFKKYSEREKIDLAAYLNFFQNLLEDFFDFDDEMDFDDEEYLDDEDLELEEEFAEEE